jgi:CBS domain-containing protein
MKRSPYPHLQRRSRLVNPKLQGAPAVLVAVVVLAAGALVGFLLLRDIRQALGNAANSGHFGFPTPFRIVSDILVGRLLVLFALVFAGGFLAFLWSLRRIRQGVSRLVLAFERSGKGDLSSPTDAHGFKEIVDFGLEIDEVRTGVLILIGEVRAEAAAMRGSALSEEEFADRWEALKGKMGRIVP